MNDQFLAPVFQDTSMQQKMAQQAMSQGNQLASQALTGSGFDPQKMAEMLRQGSAQQPQQSQITQLTPQQQLEIMRLGSNPYNPNSGYMTGTNGWGNYGE
jgi:hypothetical protein